MLWIFLALAGYFFWSLVNVGDKYIVTNRMQSPLVYMVWLAFFNVGLLAVIPFIHFFVPSMWLLALLAFAGAIYFFGGLLYAGALALEDITRLNVWWGLIPVFVFTFAWLALGETLSGWQLVAFILLVCGVVVASLHVRGRVVRISRALWFMIASCLLFAGYAVLLRFVTQEVPFVVAFVWASLFATAVAPLVFLSTTFRRQFQSSANTLAGGVWRGVLVVTVLDNMFRSKIHICSVKNLMRVM